ncbi:PadR family transcriptional regulator [Mycobacterium sp. ITM-2016-00318]|uniref:PadR family transcriptional regulator n=1 Tax=Mycobacterium sp. ITM-2016-00318 TaxID=2099693 RepID=UPI000CF8986D|nr:PadR family transcriptional regulator [Mycobacterium sp. ITM-2016-00318]WNG93517.1 PadR family transcriptional regulator [Mycobacterium sp. ITM-2016-00318]
MPSKPTTTSFALLGLLGIKTWSAYEIVAQIRRGLRFYWPRSDAHLYAELKRIVDRGHATAETVEGPRKQRTLYTITPEGRTALAQWFDTEPAPPVVEIEAFLRMFLGDQTSAERLRETLEATTRQARQFHVEGYEVIKDVLDTGGPFPHRLHLVVPMAVFLDKFYRLLIDWCEETMINIDEWPNTRDVGLSPRDRERLERIFAQPDP